MQRTKRFHVILSEDERQMLALLSEQDGVDNADVLRGLLRSAFKASGLKLKKTKS